MTSRNQLTSLVAAEGAHPLTLDLLTADEARELLARRLGERPPTGKAVRLEATRPPLGLTTAPGADAVRTWARREAIICLFTDGVTEALGGRGERFGEERVLGHVARLKDRSAREILESVHADLAGFTGGAPPADDRTVVILKM